MKSWRDVDSTDFRSKVMSQISYSRKHGTKELYIALCGDLTDSRQAEKIRSLVSNISEMKDDYVKVISPEKAVTIYRCYIKKQHPITLVRGSKEITDLLLGLAKSLSDEYYSASISLEFKIKENLSYEIYPFRLSLKLRGTKKEKPLKSMDLIRRAVYLGEEVTLPTEEIENLMITRDGQVIYHGKPPIVVIKPEKKFLPPLIFQVIDEKGRPMSSFENIIFQRYISPDKKVILISSDDNLPIKISLTIDPQDMKTKIRYNFDTNSGDVEQYLKFYRFMNALKKTKTIQILQQKDQSVLLTGKMPNVEFEQDEGYIRIIEALTLIQRESGTRIPLPIKIEASDVTTIMNTAKLLENGKIDISSFSFITSISKTRALSLLNELKEKGKIEKVILRAKPYIVNILGVKVIVGNICIEIPEAVPTKSLDDLEKELESIHEDEEISIEFVNTQTKKPTVYLESE